mmetsp:Transcript_9899/g.14408  ORF Transcript_9899/g.14408 Transcript_9899/m.14408 type:complete len:121 (-) Transcript_9899:53-415(-)
MRSHQHQHNRKQHFRRLPFPSSTSNLTRLRSVGVTAFLLAASSTAVLPFASSFTISNNSSIASASASASASAEQRDAMLAQLDDMLIVPPHLEQNGHEDSGQFDDAEEEEELDENDRTIL